MNAQAILGCGLIILETAGCASSPPTGSARPPYVKPGLIMLTADQAERRGIKVEAQPQPGPPPGTGALDASGVLSPADIKVYTFNRSVDPADSELMHEEHVVYRRETTPRWRLDAAADQKILVGPRVTDGRQELQPLLSKELTTFLSEQGHALEANQKAIAALFEAVAALNRQQQVLAHRDGARPVTPPASEPGEAMPAGPAPSGSAASEPDPGAEK